MTDLAVIIRSLERRGVTLRVEGTQIQVSPPGSLTASEKASLRQLDAELIEYLSRPTIGQTEIWLGHLVPGTLDPGARPTAPCWSCFTTRFWRRSDGPWTCSRCHPPPVPDDDAMQWLRLPAHPQQSKTPLEASYE